MRPKNIDLEIEANLARIAISNRQEDLSRRSQALLAAAGMCMPARHWYVMTVENGMDRKVAEAMIFAGVECWLPHILIVPPRRGKMKGSERRPVQKPAFPGYVFVQVQATTDAWCGLLSVKGTAAILGSCGRPLAVADQDVARLKKYLSEDRNAADVVTRTPKARDRIIIKDGPFLAHEGTVKTVDVDRGLASVEVLIFGRITPVGLTLAHISKL